MKDNIFALRKTSAGLFILCISGLTLFGQGQLPPPPGAPGPTMKTLLQVEPRIDLQNAPATAVTTTNASNLFIIKAPGSYYLTANITGVSGKNGILIDADNVTVDLNGFAIEGVEGSVNGIIMAVQYGNLRIHNGSVRRWGGSGIYCAKANNSQFDHLRVSFNVLGGLDGGAVSVLSDINAEFNGYFGIVTEVNSMVTNCNASSNGSAGIAVNEGSTVTNCVAGGNSSDGIKSYNFCTIKDCTTVGNAFSGIMAGVASTIIGCTASTNTLNGISAGDGSTISKCAVRENKGDGIHAGPNCHVSDCAAGINGSGTTGSGIATGIRASISGCTAIGNKADGIVFSGDSFVLNNHASTNGGAGFHDLGSASRIDGNVSRENTGTGILANVADTVVRNNSGANGNGVANNQYGPTAGANWGPVGIASSATSPWANF